MRPPSPLTAAVAAAPLALLLALSPAAAGGFPTCAPNDPLYPDQGQLMAPICDVEGAWRFTTGNPAIVVGILDSGADYAHEDTVRQYFLNPVEVAAESAVDANRNGVIDRHDLAKSGVGNGIDDDRNGYVDDFSGFDFDDDDNDEDDAIDFGHGAGRCGIIVAETDNGVGIAGVCPDCKVMSIRIGDTFVVSADDLGRGVVFAADAGASVVNMALGALGNSRMTRQAFAYAVEEKAVVFCASIGNQWSFHHHWPATYDDMIAMGALDPVTPSGPWAERANYSNFGGHLWVTSPSDTLTTRNGGGYTITSGTSTASPHCSGVAALLRARALALDTDSDPANDIGGLTANEVKQILRATATDIVLTADGARVGWDQFTGYGRLDAGGALAAVAVGTIPPEANFKLPAAYAYLDPVTQPLVIVRGMARARRMPGLSYLLEYGYGIEPAGWTLIATGVAPTTRDGILGLWDLRSLPLDPARPATHAQRFAITLRLRVTDVAGNRGEDRRVVFVRHDPDLRAGFPIDLASSVEGSPILTDLTGDGRLEIVLANSDGEIVVLDATGAPVPGWPARTMPPTGYPTSPGFASGAVEQTGSSIVGAAAAADLDGDCATELVVTTMQGWVEAFTADGARLFAASSDTGEAFATAPAVVDLDADGDLEVIAGSYDQQIYAFHHDGSRVSGWPVLLRDLTMPNPDHAPIISSPAIGDLDGDGSPEIVIGTGEVYDGPEPSFGYGRMYALHADGSPVAGWPVGGRDTNDLAILFKELDAILPVMGEGVVASPVLVDLDGDGASEVVAGTPTGPVMVYGGDGRFVSTVTPAGGGPRANATKPVTLFGISTPAIADFDGDGRLDLATQTITLDPVALQAGGSFRRNVEFTAAAWSLTTGAWLPGFPRLLDDWTVISSVVAVDVDGDGRREVVAPSAGYQLHAFDADGDEPVGWPKFTGGWIAGPAVGDLDGDGGLEVVATTREGNLFVWNTTGRAPNPATDWLRVHGDNRNTGNQAADLTAPAAPGNLSASRIGGTIQVRWTAPGDDLSSGTARAYLVRWSGSPIACANWLAATPVGSPPLPAPPGTLESFGFADPVAGGRLFVAVRAIDEAGNRSPVAVVEVSGASTGIDVLRAAIALATPRATVLPLDPVRDLYAASAASPVVVVGEGLPGVAGLVFYQVPAAARLDLLRVGADVSLTF